ncbi:MAG: pyridoxal-phosphate dependent enzyme [Chloroflexota bacterium]
MAFDAQRVEPGLPGIWRYRHAFGFPESAPVVSLGEGHTSLEWREIQGRQVGFKLEYENPSGSFKDRGSAVLVSWLKRLGVQEAVEDSSGNAGASFAAYAAEAGIRARVFIPDAASGPKRQQIEDYGAQLVRVMGPRSNAAQAVLQEAENGAVYASHAYLPFVLAGYASLAYELYEQMATTAHGSAPGSIIVPAGQGNLMLALGRGFQALQKAGLVAQVPRLIGVQALACAPLWAIYRYGAEGLGWVTEGETLAEGVRARYPMRGDVLLQWVHEFHGRFVAVEEEKILPGREHLKSLGFWVEPTSAITWDAFEQLVKDGGLEDPTVLILTGAGFKSQI